MSVALGVVLAVPLVIAAHEVRSGSTNRVDAIVSECAAETPAAARGSAPESSAGAPATSKAATQGRSDNVIQLRGRVRALEQELAREKERLDNADPHAKDRGLLEHLARIYEPSARQLELDADRCGIRYPILPESAHGDPDPISAKSAENAELDDEDRAVVDGLFADVNREFAVQVRDIYTSVSGNEASDLSLRAMGMEIIDKTGDSSLMAEARRELTHYRAGRIATIPAKSANPITRLLDAYYRRAENYRDGLSASFGVERAVQLRAKLGTASWGEFGCPTMEE